MMSNFGAVNEGFAKWATSFSGCDGADLNAPIWICGIEDGGKERPKEYKFISKDDLQGISYDTRSSKCETCYPNFFTGNPYDINALKLHAAIFDEFSSDGNLLINGNSIPSPDGVREYAEKHRAYEKRPTNARSIFKLNLYPMAFQNTDENLWSEKDIKDSGILTKDLYKAWCLEQRIMSMNSWIPTSNMPRVVIGTGNYLNEFVLAFRKLNSVEDFISTLNEFKCNLKEFNRGTSEALSESPAKRFKCYYHKKNDEPLLIMIPFLGVGGLSSHKDISAIGQWISELLVKHCNFSLPEKSFK
jgi:hypothetical protein